MEIKCPNCDEYVAGIYRFDKASGDYTVTCPRCKYTMTVNRLRRRKK